MSEDKAFVASARATAFDDPARLVYADWLDERGDPRGEFIRLQSEMARWSPADDDFAARRPRRNELRGQIDPLWLNAMGYRPTHRPLFTTLPKKRLHRWRLIEEFIDTWHRPLGPDDGYSEEEIAAAETRLGVSLPEALREWYALGGKRKDVWSRQDHLLPPSSIRSQEGLLIFRVENQGCERWGIPRRRPVAKDPGVVEVSNGERISPTVSAFASMMVMREAMFSTGAFFYSESIPGEILREAFPGKLARCDLPDRYWVANPVHIYEGTDLIVNIDNHDWAYVTARTEEALDQLDGRVRQRLERHRFG